jgi:HSP20 family molecular chaperone IbpA
MTDPTHWFTPLVSRRHLDVYEPKLRMLEDERAYKLIAAVPGVAADGVSLTVTDDGLLKVEAKSKTDGREVLSKTLRLAEDADVQAVKASCTDGILEVTVSKAQPPAAVTVNVAASEPPSAAAAGGQREFVLTKKLPGLAASEVNITLEPRIGRSVVSYQLVIHATSAKGYGEYHFSHSLPEDIVPDAAKAFCCHGLLHVRVPRKEPMLMTVPVMDTEEEESASGDQYLQLANFRAPGFSAQNVKLQATPGCLVVKFERSEGEAVERLVVLPDEVKDLHSLRAVCVDGVLSIKVMKSALQHATPRQVQVSGYNDAEMQMADK